MLKLKSHQIWRCTKRQGTKKLQILYLFLTLLRRGERSYQAKNKYFFNWKTQFKHHENSWSFAFCPNESDSTILSMGLGLSDTIERSLLGDNGHLIGFLHFCPKFKTPRTYSQVNMAICHQKILELFKTMVDCPLPGFPLPFRDYLLP